MERGLYFFEYVNRKASDIVAIVDSRALDIFQSATDSAVDKTAQFRSRLHVEFVGFEIGREVEIVLGKPQDRGYAVLIPIKWRAKNQAGLFPAMDADLEIASLDDKIADGSNQRAGTLPPAVGTVGRGRRRDDDAPSR